MAQTPAVLRCVLVSSGHGRNWTSAEMALREGCVQMRRQVFVLGHGYVRESACLWVSLIDWARWDPND